MSRINCELTIIINILKHVSLSDEYSLYNVAGTKMEMNGQREVFTM